jgi:DNA-binding response OmpR family regulator
MAEEYERLNFSQAPRIVHATDAKQALILLRERRFDLVITMARVGSMKVHEFGMKVKRISADLPVVLLAYNTRELSTIHSGKGVDYIFVWSGDSTILLAITKMVEDKRNVDHDIEHGDVQVLLMVEDSPRFYSKYLPRFYKTLFKQTSRLMYEGFNIHDRMLRLRARAKVLLATNYEEALSIIKRYDQNIIGLFTDGRFPRNGKLRGDSGLRLVKQIREDHSNLPVLFLSTEDSNMEAAEELGAKFINKDDGKLHAKIRKYMESHMGFGDFVFRNKSGEEVARANTLVELKHCIGKIDDEVLVYHAQRNHFSHWLRTRTEFDLAARLRPAIAEDFSSTDDIRKFITGQIDQFLRSQREQEVFDFTPEAAKISPFQRLGGGSLGGKGRGLAFFFTRISELGLQDEYPGVEIGVPRTLVLATEKFTNFIESNKLAEIALSDVSDEELAEAFLAGEFADEELTVMRQMLDLVDWPLAVRSSSLLEDALHQPFAGVYSTFMLPNDHPDIEVRVKQLAQAIKLVYASTFYSKAKAYVAATPNSIEEERMAVVIQEVVGAHHGESFYPTIAGVARSHNHYPVGSIEPEDGLAAIALGLGRSVAEGEKCIRVSPAHPKRIHQFANVEETLKTTQRAFWSIRMNRFDGDLGMNPDQTMMREGLNRAQKDGQLDHIGSTYIAADDRIVDSIMHEGPKLVTMHGALKSDKLPLMKILRDVLSQLENELACPVEIEFAYVFDEKQDIHRFALVQLRPLVADSVDVEVDLDMVDQERLLLRSSQALGNGVVKDIRDIVYVNPTRLDRLRSMNLVNRIERINLRLVRQKRPYLLIGPGRWGSSDSSLGIPVSWSQISGAASIVECEMVDIKVEPSQGTHFFQNIVSFGVGYLTVRERDGEVDFSWLDGQRKIESYGPLRHVRLRYPLHVLIDSKRQDACVVKPSD